MKKAKVSKTWVQEEDTLNSAQRCQGRFTKGDDMHVVL